MRLTSPAFTDGARLPERFAERGVSGGRNLSIPFTWSGEPTATRSFALAVIDHHPVAHGWVHWVVADIPPETHELPEGASGGAMPAGAIELSTSFGATGYGGPLPPAGSGVHDYVATLYALDVPRLSVPAAATWTVLRDAMQGHVLASAEITGRFGR